MCTTPASRHAVYISRTSPAFSPAAFRTSRACRACAAASVIGWCVKFGVAMITASTSGIGTDRFEVGRDVVAAPVGAPLVEQLAAGVAHAGQPRPRIEPNRRHVVIIADRPRADDANANRIGCRMSGHVGRIEKEKVGRPVSQNAGTRLGGPWRKKGVWSIALPRRPTVANGA